MSESSENYYYEIALTNRQVLVSFVVLLGCVLLAFGAGVWVGRMGQGQVLAAEAPRSGAPADATSALDDLEEFRFASDEPADGLNKPDLSELRGEPASTPPAQSRAEARPAQAPAQRPPQPQAEAPPPPSRGTTLAEDIGNNPSSQTQQAPPRQAPPPSPPPPRQAPPPPRQAPPPAADSLPAGEGFVVQVFATREEAQAQKVQGQLGKAGFQAFISSVRVGTTDNYRVRVGPYAERDPAERAARQITNDFKLETWVTAASN